MLNPWETVLTGNVDDGTVFDAPFTETLDGWHITQYASPGYPVISAGGYADIRFSTQGGEFTHDPFPIRASTRYVLHVECQLNPPAFTTFMPVTLSFSNGSSVSDSITNLSVYFFVSHDYRFTTPEGAETVQVSFSSYPSQYFLRNCSLVKDE